MKIKGRKLEGPNTVLCVLPRGDGEDIVFEAQAIIDMEEFEKRCPLPKPPEKETKAGRVQNYEDPVFQKQIEKHGQRRIAWMILKSLQATEGLEWEKVDMSDPKTWTLWEEELKESYFSDMEIKRIQNAVFEANSLSEAAISAARENFIRGREAELENSSSPTTEQNSGQSGKPASDSE